jgi:hypothetical protein
VVTGDFGLPGPISAAGGLPGMGGGTLWNEPTDADLRRLPRLYATESVAAEETLIYEHFFLGGCDWFAAEYCPERRHFFGFAILNNDHANAEWGYFALDELRDVAVGGIEIDRDLHWKVRAARDVDTIACATRL